MPTPSRIALLPESLRSELDQWIVAHGFAGYEAAAAWLATRGRVLGIDGARLPKRSALQDYGARLKQKLDAIRDSTHAAHMMAELFPDDEGLRGAATTAIVQTELFNLMLAFQEMKDGDDVPERARLLAKVAQAAAALSRAGIDQKRWQQALRHKAKAAAARAGAVARAGGLSSEGVAKIRQLILGVVA